MPFTNIEIVRQHLSESGMLKDSYRDVPVTLNDTSPVALSHPFLKAGSVVVKGKEIGEPLFEEITLTDEPVNLAAQELIPDSVVVAADSSLSMIYTENADYHIDYHSGKITGINDGSIDFGDQLAVWYYRYKIHTEGIDYTVDLEKGTITRRQSGDIEDGQVVFVDYQTQAGFFEESQISNAITEADDMILKLIDPIHYASIDQALITAETYLAVSILCRMKSVASLDSVSGAGSGNAASNWIELSENYKNDSLQLVARYAAPKSSLQSPLALKGGGDQ